jgi:probable phosphoglycerate mutase
VRELLLVRHGETSWNVSRRMQGHTDIPLNERGLWQAAQTARRLAELAASRPISRVVSSDLQRAAQTAALIAQALGQPVHHDPVWRERAYGVIEGHTPESVAQRWPDLHEGWRSRDPAFPVPGGESLQQFADRVSRALDALLTASHPPGAVVVVAHGGVLDIIYRSVRGIDLRAPREHSLVNAAINHLRHADQGWQIVSWGDDSHLQWRADEIEP